MAQCDTCPKNIRPLPKMWVDSAKAERRRKLFSDNIATPGSKYKKLIDLKAVNKPSFFIPINSFNNLLNSLSEAKVLRIYFSRYDSTYSPKKFKLKNNQLLLLFTGDATVNASGKAFFIDNKENLQEVKNKYKKNWISGYKSQILHSMDGTIDLGDSENEDSTEKVRSDTKSIAYQISKIKAAFVDEVNFQDSAYDIQIIGYQVSYSIYEDTGRSADEYDDGDSHKYKKRFFIQFEYIYQDSQGVFKVLNLADQPCYECRKYRRAQGKAYALDAADTGHLCPANCPSFQ